MDNNNLSQERISQKLSPASESRSKKGVIIGILCTVAVLVVATIIIVLFLPGTESNNTVVTPDNVDEILANMQDSERTPVGQYEVIMNTSWEFATGSSASTNAYVENATSNTNAVYFDIVRSDTGETIYTSPTISVGSHLENITLDTELAAGSYACVLTYHLLNDSGEPVSTLNINLDIHVNN